MINFNYITTNKINGKKYVGSHSTNDLINDKYLGSGLCLLKAIKKYGKENFTRDVLNRTLTQKGAFHNEGFLIAMYMTLDPSGYNLSPKGGLGINGCHSEETKIKMSEAHKGQAHKKGEDSPSYGKKHSEETKKKMSDTRKGKKRKPFSKEWKQNMSNACKGRKHSEKTKQKIRESCKGINKGEKNGMFGISLTKNKKDGI